MESQYVRQSSHGVAFDSVASYIAVLRGDLRKFRVLGSNQMGAGSKGGGRGK